MKQATLDFNPIDPIVPMQAKKRLSGQNARIIERLRQGPATNRELVLIALKYTSRISDLRAHGFKIVANINHESGITYYTLGG